jgi:protein gp37
VPYTWKKPQLVFVNSMSDLFHPEVPLEFIQQVFEVMGDNPKHRTLAFCMLYWHVRDSLSFAIGHWL